MDKSRWRRRVSLVEAIYSEFLCPELEHPIGLEEWTDFEKQVFQNYLKNKDKYIKLLNTYLKEGWELDRLNAIASSILLEALSEFNSLNTPPNILIEQSVKTAKNYCGEDEYKLINGVLENCLKNGTVNN